MEPATTQLLEAPPPPPAPPQIEEIELGRFRPSKWNPRSFAKKPTPELVDLACSVRRHGLIQPITARPILDDSGELIAFYEIVAGERRWRSHTMCRSEKGVSSEVADQLEAAGPDPTTIRAIIRQMSDEEAMEVVTIENLEREDLKPMEEAKGVENLMTLYRGDVEAIASKLNKPVTWVSKRIRLMKLSKAWQANAGNPESSFCTWTAAHLLEIARLDPKAQDTMLKKLNNHHSVSTMSVEAVRKVVTDELRTIGLAVFDPEDAALVPKCGPCSTCPSTSMSTPGLFADLGDDVHITDFRKARCLNPDCWTLKMVAWAKQRVATLKGEGQEAFLVADGYWEVRAYPQGDQNHVRQIDSYEYEASKAGAKDSFAGVFVFGERAGQVVYFRRKQRAGSFAGSSRKGGKVEEKPATPLKERREKLERRRRVLAVEKIAAAIKASEKVPAIEILVRIAIAFGTQEKQDALYSWGGREDPWKTFDSGKDLSLTTDLNPLLWQRQLMPVLLSRLTYQGSGTDIKKLFLNASRAAALVDVDAEALYEEAVKEIPEPKSWALLKEDGTPKSSGAVDKIKQPAKKGSADGKSQGKASGPATTAPAKRGRQGAAADRKKVGARAVAAMPSSTAAKPSVKKRSTRAPKGA